MEKHISVLALLALCCGLISPGNCSPLQSTLSDADLAHYFGKSDAPDYELVHVKKQETNGTEQYNLEAFGRDLSMILNPVDGFFISSKHQCHYEGKLVDGSEASIAISTCNGLSGYISVGGDDYFIAKLTNAHGMKVIGVEDPHIIFKGSPSGASCTMQSDSKMHSDLSERRSAASRKRRAIDSNPQRPGTKYVELSVYVDKTMYDYYGENVEAETISTFNQVRHFYTDKSLGNDIKLNVQRITVFKESDQDGLVATDDADIYLSNFCNWQQLDGNADISILVTRLDLQSSGYSGVTGMASDIGGACDASRRCVLAEDHGLAGRVFTIAHETAHALGIYHDGELSNCKGKEKIMSSSTPTGKDAYKWSSCSRDDLSNFLESDASSCLDNNPTDKLMYNPTEWVPPGWNYDATQQCQDELPGTNAEVAASVKNTEDVCKELMCDTGEGLSMSSNVPALPGTQCGTRYDICYKARCLHIRNTRQCSGQECPPTWTSSSWGACTNCEQTRVVACVRIMDDGTVTVVTDLTLCPTEVPIEFQYCNCDLAECVDLCVTQTMTYMYLVGTFGVCNSGCGASTQTRGVACIDENGNTVTDSNCETAGLTRPASTQDCTNYDNCQYQTGTFGSCSVTCGVGTMTRSVACVDVVTGVIVDTNNCATAGLTQPSFTQACNLGDCVTTYIFVTTPFSDCSVTCGTGVESRTVSCADQTTSQIVDTQFCLDAGLAEPEATLLCTLDSCPAVLHTFVTGDFGECSVTCGGGVQVRSVDCVVISTNEIVSNDFCLNAGLGLPASSADCNTGECPSYTYLTGGWSQCSVTCGSGVETRSTYCIILGGTNIIVDDAFCVEAGLTAPESVRICDTNVACPTRYVYVVGAYGTCSTTCGAGVQVRTVECVDTENNNAVVDDAFCTSTHPGSVMDCDLGMCPEGMFQYITNAYSPCDCNGLQTRTVLCIYVVGGTLLSATNDDCLNAGLAMPAEIQSCTPPSSCSVPVWSFSEWSPCSVTCGIGNQPRSVFCLDSSGFVVDDANCDSTTRPADTQACDSGVCPTTYMYFSTAWSSCSTTCGEGVETRTVTCYQIDGTFMPVDDAFCAGMDKPPSTQLCENLPPCGGVWVATDWSECSATCSVGNQGRSVACYRTKAANELLDAAECTDPVPALSRICYLTACPLLPGCGETIEAVVGQSYVFTSPGFPANYPDDYECDTVMTTTEGRIEITFTEFNVEECVNCDCDVLTITDGSIATDYCGVPEVPFTVTSSGSTFLAAFSSDASVTRRGYTATFRVLPTDGIQYITGEFGECSVTCGEGVRSRSVTCYNDGVEVDDAVCSGLERPAATEACVLEDCRASDFCGNDTVRTVSGETILSPGFPDPYEPDLVCVNIIKAPVNHIIQFTAVYFLLEDSENCTKDSVTFAEDGAEDVALCGAQYEEIFLSTSNQVNVTFVSDGDTENLGYIIEFTFIQVDVNLCGDLLLEAGQVFSPNYPGNYDDDEDCTTTIFAGSQCIEIEFNVIEIEDSDDCDKDYLEISDLLNTFLKKKICGSVDELTFQSFSPTVSLQFVSDSENNDVGFYGDLRFVDCPLALFTVGPYSECSVSCGGGERTRTVECVDEENNVLPDAICGEAPSSTEECGLEECPSCDVVVTDIGEDSYQIRSPNYPDDYNNNDNCTYTIVSPDGNCILMTDTAFDLEGADDDGECTNDFVEVYDLGFPTVKQVDCGTARTETIFQSLSSQVQQRFVSNGNVTDSGFLTFVTFVPCPTYAYLPGEWSDCSVSCGEGERTRTVDCWFIAASAAVDESLCNGDKPPTSEVCIEDPCPECDEVINTEEFFTNKAEGEDTYDENQDCVYSVVAPDDMCVTLFVFDYELEDATDGVCENDYFTLTDTSDLNLNQTFCGTGTFITFQTASSTALVTFHSDDEDEYEGFNILPDFNDCPTYIYRGTSFGDCDRTCGNGMQTRTIYCVMVSTGDTVDDSDCDGLEEPPVSQTCNLGPCPECDEFLTEGDVLQISSYEPNLNCRAEITVAEGECVDLVKLTFDLPEPVDNECTDSIEIFDIGNDAPGIEVCGTDFTGFTSRSNAVDVRFESNNDTESGSYTIVIAAVECPTYGFVSGEYDDCTRSCGGGTQVRTVECQELETETVVDDSMCSDAKPEESRDCNTFDCPPCGEMVEDENQKFTDPAGADAEYENLRDCTYTVSASDGNCPGIFFSTFEMQDPDSDGTCLDYVQIDQPGFENTFYQFCGTQISLFVQTASQEVTLTFYTDDSIVAEGFEALNAHTPCPDFAYAVGEFGECSATCGWGYRVRELLCIDLSDNSEVDLSECDNLPHLPVLVNETCSLEECPGCDSVVLISEPVNLEVRFENSDECETNLTAADGECLVVFFQTVDLPTDCEENYIEYYDANAPWLNGKLCDGDSSITFVSQSSNIILSSENDGTAADSDGITFIAAPSNCPTYGFVVSEETSCSVTCGEGVLTRSYECQNLETEEVVDDSDCDGDVPSSTASCELDECPSCDRNITSTATVTVDDYANDQDCTYTINLDSCFSVIFVTFDLEPANNDGQCVDYILLTDPSQPQLNRTICGDDLITWTSASNQGIIYFKSNENITAGGFLFLITEVDSCADYAYDVSEWSMCPCGSGESEQTREVTCVQLSDGSVVDDDMCSGTRPDETQTCQAESCDGCFEDLTVNAIETTSIQISEEEYVNNIDCVYNITADEGICMSLVILSFNLEDSEDCENDFIQVLSKGIDMKLCGSISTGDTIPMRTNEAQVIFRTNGNVTSDGLQLIFIESDCPEYGFVAGEFSECSKTCGSGVRTRTVECQKLQAPDEGEVQMDESLCTDEEPEDSESCNEDDCPVCLIEYAPSATSIISTDPFDNNTDCYYRSVGSDTCISIGLTDLDIADPDDEGNCTTDYIEVRDLDNPDFSFIRCGQIDTLELFTSSSNAVEILIHVEDGTGKSASFFFLETDCKEYEQVISGFGDCSQTCGGGERTRVVECRDVETSDVVEDFYCYLLDQVNVTEPCGDTVCPECNDDTLITIESGELESPGDDEYGPDEDCSYNLNTQPDCALITIDEFDIPDGTPGNCEDYLRLTSQGTDYVLCAQNLTGVQFAATYFITSIQFVSDSDSVVGSGFSLRFDRQSCPDFEFVVGEYGNCTVECRRTRIVECLDDDDNVVDDTMCFGIKPDTWEECSTSPCGQAYYEYVTGDFGDCETSATPNLCFQYRDVDCQNNETGMVVDDSFCDQSKPAVSDSCTCPVMTTMGQTPATDAPEVTTAAMITAADMTTPTPECGGAFGETPTDGMFTSPNYPSDYPPDITCVWNFTVPAGSKVVFKINTFEVENPGSGSCTDANSDYIQFVDSDEVSVTVCILDPATLPATINSALQDSDFTQLIFKSNSAIEDAGFSIDYSYISET